MHDSGVGKHWSFSRMGVRRVIPSKACRPSEDRKSFLSVYERQHLDFLSPGEYQYMPSPTVVQS
jgi:hypothetical protein